MDKGKLLGDNIIGLLVVAVVFGMLLFVPIKCVGIYFWGNQQIGSFFEESGYTAQYYVNLFPEDSEAKNYRVKADIQSEVLEDVDANDKSHYWRAYHILRAYFPNGGYVSFDERDNETLVVGKKITQTDNDDNNWEVELTNERVK